MDATGGTARWKRLALPPIALLVDVAAFAARGSLEATRFGRKWFRLSAPVTRRGLSDRSDLRPSWRPIAVSADNVPEAPQLLRCLSGEP